MAISRRRLYDLGVLAFAFDLRTSAVYVSTSGFGVYRSGDGVGKWKPFGRGLPESEILSLIFDSKRRTLYAGTDGRGVFDYQFPG